jgi:hypothetical protein
MTDTLPAVSDHAVLRYLERVQGFNIEAVRTHIGVICRSACRAGAASLKTEGVEFQFAKGTVVTVTPKTRGPTKTRQRLSRGKVPA